ncbi:hypothetical protein BHM03_00016040 [Ensete ventricosum]|nr:hypothetical protein BHM03_00016040 [Ensete ventricosum]
MTESGQRRPSHTIAFITWLIRTGPCERRSGVCFKARAEIRRSRAGFVAVATARLVTGDLCPSSSAAHNLLDEWSAHIPRRGIGPNHDQVICGLRTTNPVYAAK